MSLFVELLRARPRLMFWITALMQAALWTLVPALFYAAPPGEVPLVLAIGHELQFGTDVRTAARVLARRDCLRAGRHALGVYFLSQICVVVTYWAVFALGRAIVGASHAVMAVMLMAGIAVFSVPTPEFGPAMLAMPLWALMLLHYWRACRRQARELLGRDRPGGGLLLLTT